MMDRNECPRCRVGRLRAWKELSEEEQEIVRRLPAAAHHSAEERMARHRWCTQCWHEATGRGPENV